MREPQNRAGRFWTRQNPFDRAGNKLYGIREMVTPGTVEKFAINDFTEAMT